MAAQPAHRLQQAAYQAPQVFDQQPMFSSAPAYQLSESLLGSTEPLLSATPFTPRQFATPQLQMLNGCQFAGFLPQVQMQRQAPSMASQLPQMSYPAMPQMAA